MNANAVVPGVLILLALADPATAALVYVTGRDKPVAGYVDQSEPQVVVVRETLPGGQSREIRVPREQVQDILATVDPQRLESLSPDDPEAYRDYAEELAEIADKQRDPEARDAALRLFLIAAQLDRAGLGRSCLLGMAEIALTPSETRRYRAMAYLLDPQHNRKSLDRDRPSAATDQQALEPDEQTVLLAVQALRQDDARRARLLAEQPGFPEAFAKWSRVLDYDQFLEAARSEPDASVLRKLLQIELAIQESNRGADFRAAGEASAWSRTIREHGTRPGFPLQLDSITPWDPADCVYRNGRWTNPEQQGDRHAR